jgi:hypothetical protein
MTQKYRILQMTEQAAEDSLQEGHGFSRAMPPLDRFMLARTREHPTPAALSASTAFQDVGLAWAIIPH